MGCDGYFVSDGVEMGCDWHPRLETWTKDGWEPLWKPSLIRAIVAGRRPETR